MIKIVVCDILSVFEILGDIKKELVTKLEGQI